MANHINPVWNFRIAHVCIKRGDLKIEGFLILKILEYDINFSKANPKMCDGEIRINVVLLIFFSVSLDIFVIKNS